MASRTSSPLGGHMAGRSVVALVLMAVLAAGCGDGDAEDAAGDVSAAANPCQLVTVSEVETALDSPVNGGTMGVDVATAVVGETACQFTIADPAKPPSIVRVGVTRNFAPIVFKKFVDQHPGAQPVPDLGDEAVWVDGSKVLVAREGDAVVSTVVFGAAVDDHRARAIRLAERALSRL